MLILLTSCGDQAVVLETNSSKAEIISNSGTLNSTSTIVSQNLADIKSNKNNQKFFNLYQYVKDNYKFTGYKLSKSSGDASSTYVVVIEPEITFNNSGKRVDSNGNSTVHYMRYDPEDINAPKSGISISIYSNENNLSAYTFDSDIFIPDNINQSLAYCVLKYENFIIVVQTRYSNENLDIHSEEYYNKSNNFLTEATKTLIQLLKNYTAVTKY